VEASYGLNSRWWTLNGNSKKYFWKTPRPREHKLCLFAEVTSGERWRPVLLYRIGFKLFSALRNRTLFLFAFSKIIKKKRNPHFGFNVAADGQSHFSRLLAERRHLFDTPVCLTILASEHLKEPDRATTSLKIKTKTFTKWYLYIYITDALFCKRCTLAPSTRLFESHQDAWGVKLWMVGRILFPQVCCVALVSGVKHTSRTLVLWLTC